MAGPVKIAILADAGQATAELAQVAKAVNSTEERLDAAGRAAGKWADKADFAGGAAAKMAGGLGDVADGLAANGIISQQAADAADKVVKGMMIVAGAADIATTASALYAAAQEAGGLAAAKNAAATVAQKVATVAGTAATGAATAAQWLLNAAMNANPLGLIIAGVLLLVGGIILLWKNSETFRTVVLAVWGAIKTAALAVASWFTDTLIPWFVSIWNWITDAFAKGVAAVKAVWAKIMGLIDTVIAFKDAVVAVIVSVVLWIHSKIQEFVDKLKAIWAGILGLAATVFELRDKVIAVFVGLVDRIKSIAGDIVSGLVDGLSGAWHKVVETIKALVGKIPKAIQDLLGISSPSKVMRGLGTQIGAGLAAGIDASRNAVARSMTGLADVVTGTGFNTAPIAIGGSATAAASVVNVNVNVPPSADPAEVGRQVVKTIRAYETSTGRTVLAAT